MNCHEFENRLENEIAGLPRICSTEPGGTQISLPSDPALATHLTECPACRDIWDDMQLVGEAVRVWRDAVPRVDLKERVVAEWRQANSQPESRELAVTAERARSIPALERATNWRRAAIAALLLAGIGTTVTLVALRPSNPIVVVKSASDGTQRGTADATLRQKSNSASTVVTVAVRPSGAVAMFRETASALTGTADVLFPGNRAIVSAPPRKPGDEAETKGSAIVRRDEDSVPLSQHLRETLDDLWLPAESLEAPQT